MAMRECIVRIEGASPITFSRAHEEPKLNKDEGADAYDQRTWQHKLHTTSDGSTYIPAAAFKQALDSAAKFRGLQIPGKGKATYTKHFLSGVICGENAPLLHNGKPLKKEDALCVRLHMNADGVRGSGKRVWRRLPQMTQWEANVPMLIMDDIVTKDVFELHFTEAGQFIGVGQYRPQNGGLCGRWRCLKFNWL